MARDVSQDDTLAPGQSVSAAPRAKRPNVTDATRQRARRSHEPVGNQFPPKPPTGASIELKEWEGPEDIVQALTAAKSRVWALTYLAHCRYLDLPHRTLVTTRGWVADKLYQYAHADLKAIGVRVVLEAAA